MDKENLNIPFRHKNIKPTNFGFYELSSHSVLENHFDKAKLVINEDNDFGVNNIEIRGLKPGSYRIELKKENVKIQIQVDEG